MAIYTLIICSFILISIPIVNNKLKQNRKQRLLDQMRQTMEKISNE